MFICRKSRGPLTADCTCRCTCYWNPRHSLQLVVKGTVVVLGSPWDTLQLLVVDATMFRGL